jgi:glycosyltransferase involved in cell wall biosynthesis/predicted O-methyltransferase YrrM
MTDLSAAPRTRLFTAFGTVLYVDVVSGELRHGSIESSPTNALFVADPGLAGPYRQGRLMHDSGESREPFVCLVGHCHSISRAEGNASATPTVLELIPLERGLITFTAEGLFLSAIPDGRVSLSAPACSTWELFLASEDWCTDAPATGDAQIGDISKASFDKKRIASYIIHPLIRAAANAKPKALKLLIYGYTKWSHGRVYYDLCKHLHRCGYIVDILDWQINHANYIGEIIRYYDFFMTALDGVRTLVDSYRVPYDKIIALSHHELDIRMLIGQKGIEVFKKFANYGVVSEFLYCTSLMRGVPRVPMVASLGINYWEFHTDISERLVTVGYTGAMRIGSDLVETYGIEWKRGELVEAAALGAGLAFKVAGSTENQISFHEMPDFYKTVDAVLTSSISEAAQLPVMEAAAAGRLVIGTPVGHFPLKAYQGGGIIAPIEAEKFKAFTAATLRYYKDNPTAYVDKCRAIQEAARKFDWQHSIGEWIELIETARSPSTRATQTSESITRSEYQFTADWFSHCIPVWDQLIGGVRATRILEIGSFEGRSTCYLIENCSKTEPIEIYCVDTWEGGVEHDKNAMREIEQRFDHNVTLAKQRASHAASVTKLKKSSTQALAEIIARREAPFDLIYVDGSHQAPDVLADAVLAFQLLRVGGIMIFDDYLWRLEPDGRQDPLNMPKPAIDSFINIFQRKLRIISGLPIWQLYIEKTFA